MGMGGPSRPLLEGNVVTGKNKGSSWNTDNAFVGAAACGWRKAQYGSVGDVRADNGEIAIVEFKDVGAATRSGRLFAICMRVGADSSDNSHNAMSL